MSGLLALIAILISYVVFRSQADPEVVVYASEDRERPSVINLIIENIGGGAAKKVLFVADRDIPSEAWGIDRPQGTPRTLNKGAFQHGIPVLLPGERRTYTWGQYGGLIAALDNEPLKITATFEAGRAFVAPWRRRMLKVESNFDVRSLEHVDVSDNSGASKIAKELRELRQALSTAMKQIRPDQNS